MRKTLLALPLAAALIGCGPPHFIQREENVFEGKSYVVWRDDRTFRNGPYKGCNFVFTDDATTPEIDGGYIAYCHGSDSHGLLKDAPTEIKWIAVNLAKDYAKQEGK